LYVCLQEPRQTTAFNGKILELLQFCALPLAIAFSPAHRIPASQINRNWRTYFDEKQNPDFSDTPVSTVSPG
jgi:hypothetical protein